MPVLVKYALTSALIVGISELVKRTDRIGALLAAMPMVTLLALMWMKIDRLPDEKMALHALYTFWYVLPTLPGFLLMYLMWQRNIAFHWVIGGYVASTTVLVLLTAKLAERWQIYLL